MKKIYLQMFVLFQIMMIFVVIGVVSTLCYYFIIDKILHPKLPFDLILQEKQENTLVRTWLINKNANWSIVESKNGNTNVIDQGVLSQDQLTNLAKSIRKNRIRYLPNQIGEKGNENNHTYTISFHNKVSVLYGVPTKQDDKISLQEHIANWSADQPGSNRFAAIAQLIVDNCEPPLP
jgi:hypothetical protein